MHLYKLVKNFLFDQDYFIVIWQNNIHIYGFLDILCLQEKKAAFHFDRFDVELVGVDFRVLKLTKNEVLIQGVLESMRFSS